ncbi:hypothetical protein AQ490_04055 [Wenjunlia vitaminophila]|uniref:Uncharacterized protein n=1 Tax=Wenjunlia vitaminophila TaxID=76728 RepID=A0A0T6LR12_WENVI|nr:hypothetical protein [Wenjunlia vitaminophila]KRV48436.1 hypothetical protein AQ490_04055 [Wenjunlia vitaminophila]
MGNQEEPEPRHEGRRPQLRTGGDQPIDPEDLVMASGREVTPERVEEARRLIEEKGAAAIEEYLP